LNIITFQVEVFWIVTPGNDVIGSMDLRNVSILTQHYTASQPKDLDLNLHCRENLKS